MGDTGSQLLGFLAICLSTYITQGNQPLSPLLPLIILGFPILDTLTVMTERIMKGRSPFKPDKNHFHHKLMRLGLYHTEAVFTIYVLQSLLITSAVIFRFHSEWFWLVFYSLFSGLIILAFVILDRRQWTFPRTDLIDKVIKGRLKILREKYIIIKTSFRFIEYGLPMLLAISSLLLNDIPGYFAALTGGLSLAMITCLLLRPSLSASALRFGLYLVVPFLIYMVESVVRDLPLVANRLYHMAFGVMVLFVILTLKFTRRRKGFKTTPMDFLVLFIALLVPNIPDTRIQSLHMGMVAAQIIAFLFGFEVLIGELRGELKRQMIFAAIILAIIPAKYLLI
jgi:UDP-GlcNAc:undecaprenyl-phosphate GlcNAc-1-phosphate transferase